MFQSRFKAYVDRQALILESGQKVSNLIMKSWVIHWVLLSKQYQDDIIVNIERRLAGWKRIYGSKRGRITGIMHWMVAIACFSFSTLLEFLDTFFFFFSFYLQCWCILCILSVYLNCASSHFVMTLTIKKSLQTKTNQNKCQSNIDCQLPLKYKKITIIKQNLDIIFKNHEVIPRVFKSLI